MWDAPVRSAGRIERFAMRVNWTAFALLCAALAGGSALAGASLAGDPRVAWLAGTAGGAILLAAVSAGLAARRSAADAARLSADLTTLSRRLLRIANRDADRDGPSLERVSSLAGGVATDLDALTRVVTQLAESLSAQDERLLALERVPAAPDRVEPPPAPVPPAPAASSTLTTREDFARAADTILRRLKHDPPTVQEPRPDNVLERLEAGLVELMLQPVVTLPQRRTAFYAALPHLRDEQGIAIGPGESLTALARHGRLPRLDAFVLAQSLSVCRFLLARAKAGDVSLRLSRQALGDPAFLEGAAVLLRDAAAASRLILEVDHDDVERFSRAEMAGLDALRGLGVALAVDGVPDLDRDWAGLAGRGFGTVAVSAASVLAPRPHRDTARLVAAVAAAGIRLVATEVDREPLIPDLLDFDVPFARGLAVAPPRPVRAEVVAAPLPEPAPAPPPATEAVSSFRDFLRRAG